VATVTMKQLLEAGVHFGHQTRRWNPKMAPYIFSERNGIHIIDLRQTLEATATASAFIRDLVAGGGVVLFVGTKKQAQSVIEHEATRCSMPYVNHRWLGGMLTNFATIRQRILYMRELEQMDDSGVMNALPKKERLKLRRELEKLRATLGGVRDLHRAPDAMFVIDVRNERIAITEASRLGIPIVAVVDTNCDPDLIDHVIPGNDDAIRASQLMASVVADAVLEGADMVRARAKDADADESTEVGS
jgi:small subunit ribosomal protein S2